MKKILIFLFLICAPSFASNRLHVKALDDFKSAEPKKYFSMEVIEDGQIDDIVIIRGDILNCEVKKITDPTRAKRDAKIFFKVYSLRDNKGEHQFSPSYIGKYSKSAITKEEIKKTDPKKVAKKTAGVVGGFFVKGFSYGVSFVDGAVNNKENNRLKSGAKQMYQDSVFSYVEFGKDVEIKKGDEFYLFVKKDKDAIKELSEDIEDEKDSSKEETTAPLPVEEAPQPEENEN